MKRLFILLPLAALLAVLIVFGFLRAAPEPEPEVSTPALDPCKVPPSPKPAVAESPSPELPAPEPPAPEPAPVRIKVQLAGDILLHTAPVKYASTGGGAYDFKPYFESIKHWLDGDLSVCNMESPVDALGGNTGLSSYPMFNVPYEILEALKYAGFNHLITANNHAFDKKAAGLEATLENIRRAGLTSTGTYATEEAFLTPTVLDVKGVKVGIIAYTDSYNGLQSIVPAERLPYLMRKFDSGSTADLPRMTDDIEAARRAGAELVIFALHWGAEYVDKPTQTQRDIAQALCDAGADIIMGGHSHCVQPVEWYETVSGGRKALIIYSLGNFFADQLAMQPPKPKTQYGMLADIYVTKSPDGEITLDNCAILPTLSYRDQNAQPPDGVRYRILPLYGLNTEVSPSFMPGDAAWRWGLDAYDHVSKVVNPVFLR